MQNTGKNRNTIDKFYTNPSIVDKYVNIFKSYVKTGDLIIEPSAGNGSWSIPLREHSIIAFDIQPEADNIIQRDFLFVELDSFNSNLHFIGNPPFGRQSSLAKRFIKHITSCTRSKTIAFILPKSFKKESYKKTFPLCYHLDFEDDIPEDAFILNNEKYDVPCVFQIWIRKENERFVPQKKFPKGFKFVKIDEDPHFSLRRVGVNAGTISKNINKSVQSHYFIRLDNYDDNFLTKFNSIKWAHNNTVGPKSISKQEFIKEINIILK